MKAKSSTSHSFEYRVFRWLLIGSVMFWCYRIATHLIFDDTILDLTIDFVTLLVTVAVIVALKYYNNYNHLILLYCLILIAGYVHFWYRLGGLNGPMSYSYFALIAFFVTILPRKIRETIAVLFCLFTVLLSLNVPDALFDMKPMTATAHFLLPFDYVVNSLIVAIIVVLIKRNFDTERKMLVRNSRRTEKLNVKQQQKTAQLLDQQREIKSIGENLELLVKERTAELELTNKQLEEYAFHNAHLVRKPLSNIQGLINLMEMENIDIEEEDIDNLKKSIRELDIITKKINFILQ